MRFRLRTLLIALAVGPVVAPTSPRLDAEDRRFDAAAVVRVAVELLDREHLSRRPLDDDRAKQWFDAFLSALDPMRMYFLEEDIAEFRKYTNRLDDFAKDNDFRFPEIVRVRHRQRTAQAAEMAEKFLALEPDFSVDENTPAQYDKYAGTQEELEERWRLRIKFEQLIEKPGGRSNNSVRAQLRGRYARIAKGAQEMTDERLCEIYLTALLKCYDPHSAYYSHMYNTALSGSHLRRRTLGLRLQQKVGRLVIVGMHPTIANAKADSLIGWQLLAISGSDGSTFDLVEIPYVEAMEMIMWGINTIGSDTEVTLEVFNPKTLERRSQQWIRYVDKF